MRRSVRLLQSAKSIANVLRHGRDGEHVRIQGWVQRYSEHKLIKFAHISDGLSTVPLQVVLPRNLEKKLNVGAAVDVVGKLQKSSGSEQDLDLLADNVDVVNEIERKDYPFARREKQTPDTLRHYLHLRPKTRSFGAFLRLRSRLKHMIHSYFQEAHYVLIDTPILTRNDCEAAGETFAVCDRNSIPSSSSEKVPSDSHFFGHSVYLTVSGQLHLEAAAGGLKQVYTFGPTFRAESSLTRQHLAEFHMLEVERTFCSGIEDLLTIVEELIMFCIRDALSSSVQDLTVCQEYHQSNTITMLSRIAEMQSFPRITYDEAVSILKQNGQELEASVKHMSKSAERFLVRHFQEQPVFVTNYPSEAKPFYMKRSIDGNKALCFDLLVPNVGEVCGGSLRESDYKEICRRVDALASAPQLKWYTDLRKYGYPNMGGFGLGFERFLQFILGIRNIKDCIAFPRWYGHCDA